MPPKRFSSELKAKTALEANKKSEKSAALWIVVVQRTCLADQQMRNRCRTHGRTLEHDGGPPSAKEIKAPEDQLDNTKPACRQVRLIGVSLVALRLNTSRPHPQDEIYSYSLRGLGVGRRGVAH